MKVFSWTLVLEVGTYRISLAHLWCLFYRRYSSLVKLFLVLSFTWPRSLARVLGCGLNCRKRDLARILWEGMEL
jgi:hypothetical protein